MEEKEEKKEELKKEEEKEWREKHPAPPWDPFLHGWKVEERFDSQQYC